MIRKRAGRRRIKYRRQDKDLRYFFTGVLVLFLAAIFIFWGGGPFQRLSFDVSPEKVSKGWQEEIYKKALEQGIPGMNREKEDSPGEEGIKEGEDTELVNENQSRGVINSTLYALTSIDLHDPKTFLNAQISSMQHVSYLTDYPSSFNEVNTSDKEGSSQGAFFSDREISYYEGDIEAREALLEKNSPLVVIYHTHTTESFRPTSGKDFTEDLNLTVVRVAQELAQSLENDYGARVVHNKEIHDIPRSRAYHEAVDTVKSLAKNYPEAALIIDLHRDGAAREATTTTIKGERVGRTLIVQGTNYKNWQENYQLALRLHEKSEELYPGLSRGIRKRNLVYNQDVHPHSILLEIGGHKNSLEEALRASTYVAEIIGEVLQEL